MAINGHEAMWDMQLGKMVDLVQPFSASIDSLTPDMQDYIIMAAQHDKSLEYLLTHTELDQFNRLIALVGGWAVRKDETRMAFC